MSIITTITVKIKKPWQVAKGHPAHRSGTGSHNNQPKRNRTRSTRNHQASKEYA